MNVSPPFEPEARNSRRRRLIFNNKKVPVRFLIPNFFTLLGLCAGLTAIRMAIEHRFDLAIALIVLAALLDGVDGRVARLLKGTSRFGAELDSLADFVNFGVAPAMLIFTWGLGDLKSLGWVAVLIYAICASLRLARFNAAIEEEHPNWQTAYFTGVPAPAAAIIALLPIYLEKIGLTFMAGQTLPVLVYTLFVGVLMVSAVPTFSGKLTGERVARDFVLPVFVIAILAVILLATYPYKTLSVVTLGYLALIPYSYHRYARREEQDRQMEEGTQDTKDNAPTATDAAEPAEPNVEGTESTTEKD